MEVPAKVRVVFRQIEQFGVKFHFPPYRSPHWPPNNGFQNLAPISLFSEQNCSQFFLIFRFWKPDLASIARAAFHTWTYNHRHLLQDIFFSNSNSYSKAELRLLQESLKFDLWKTGSKGFGSLFQFNCCSSRSLTFTWMSNNASSLGRICLI